MGEKASPGYGKSFYVRTTFELHRRLKVLLLHKFEGKMTMQDFVNQAVTEKLEREEANDPSNGTQ